MYEFDDDEDLISKSQVKREMQALRDLGEELVALPMVSLKKFTLGESLFDAISLAQSLKREALRRQIQRVGKLLREEDEVEVRQCLRQISQPQRDEVRAFHKIEQWRDSLLQGSDEIVNQLIEQHSNIDRQHLRQLLRNARKEQKLGKPPKSARLLFQYLNEKLNG